MASTLIVALGGTRSGKSRFGLATARRLAGDSRAWFLGTAWHGDPELDDRIRRPPSEPVLLDGFTLWLSALLGDDVPDIDALLDGPVAAALAAIDARPGPVVV